MERSDEAALATECYRGAIFGNTALASETGRESLPEGWAAPVGRRHDQVTSPARSYREALPEVWGDPAMMLLQDPEGTIHAQAPTGGAAIGVARCGYPPRRRDGSCWGSPVASVTYIGQAVTCPWCLRDDIPKVDTTWLNGVGPKSRFPRIHRIYAEIEWQEKHKRHWRVTIVERAA